MLSFQITITPKERLLVGLFRESGGHFKRPWRKKRTNEASVTPP